MCDFGFGFRQKTGFGSKLVPFILRTSSEPQFYRQFGQRSILAGGLSVSNGSAPLANAQAVGSVRVDVFVVRHRVAPVIVWDASVCPCWDAKPLLTQVILQRRTILAHRERARFDAHDFHADGVGGGAGDRHFFFLSHFLLQRKVLELGRGKSRDPSPTASRTHGSSYFFRRGRLGIQSGRTPCRIPPTLSGITLLSYDGVFYHVRCSMGTDWQ